MKLVRCLMHIPVGAFNAWLFILNPWFGMPFLVFFAIYELNEDMHLKDQAWKDIAGWLWGFSIFVLVWNLIGEIVR